MAKAKTNNPISIVDNGNYVTFTFGASATPVDISKVEACIISYYTKSTNTAKYPEVSMAIVGITTISADDMIIDCDHRFITTPTTADAPALYNEIMSYFNTNPSIITEVTDALVIAEITLAGNWTGEPATYQGSTAGLIAGSYYYDLDNNLKYEFDGTTLIRINFNTSL